MGGFRWSSQWHSAAADGSSGVGGEGDGCSGGGDGSSGGGSGGGGSGLGLSRLFSGQRRLDRQPARTSFSCGDLQTLREGTSPGGEKRFPSLGPLLAAAEEAAQQVGPASSSETGSNSGSTGDAKQKKRVLFCCHGSRGDVQPLVALALGMIATGEYDVCFWTVRPVNEFVERQGIRCLVHDIDSDDMMRRVQTRINNGQGEGLSRGLGFFSAVTDVMNEPDLKPKVEEIPDAVLTAHLAYKPDISVTSHCMPAISCAEFLNIPVVYIALQPMYPTKHFPPWAFKATNFEDGMKWLNKPLGQLFMSIYENQTYTKGVKRCRRLAGLPVRRFSDGTPVYNLRFVPTVTTIARALLPQPTDWPRWQQVTGFLMMEDGREDIWSAPKELLDFLEPPMDGGPGAEGKTSKPVYVGFGSMCGDEAMAVRLTRMALQALMDAKQRGILLGGWAGMTRLRLDPEADKALVRYAEANIFELPACPHTWLFPRCAAVVHHGGAGTLAVGLRSGCPTVVCPFIFDQEYFGGLVEEQRCGRIMPPVKELTTAQLARAINEVVTDPEIVASASKLGEAMRSESGIDETIKFIEQASTSFPYPWTIKLPGFKRDEPAWTSEDFSNFFANSNLTEASPKEPKE